MVNRILHTMIRVSDLQRSVDFYTQILGMQILRTLDQPDEKYTLVFLGYGNESDTCVLELTYNYSVSKYEMGNAFGHIAIGVDDCHAACTAIKEKGGVVACEPKPLKGSNEVFAFASDPDGFQIELVQTSMPTVL